MRAATIAAAVPALVPIGITIAATVRGTESPLIVYCTAPVFAAAALPLKIRSKPTTVTASAGIAGGTTGVGTSSRGAAAMSPAPPSASAPLLIGEPVGEAAPDPG